MTDQRVIARLYRELEDLRTLGANPRSIDLAKQLLCRIEFDVVGEPGVTQTARGNIHLAWDFRDCDVEVEVTPRIYDWLKTERNGAEHPGKTEDAMAVAELLEGCIEIKHEN